MKKIYNLLCCGALLLLASCEEEGTEVIELGTKDPVVSITGISPNYGYVGDEFDVIGENFAGAVDFVKVRIGENVAKVLACTDERITVQIPEDATTGKISVDFFDEKLKTDLMLRVLGQPSVETISREWGFIGDLITFTGTGLGTKAEDIKMVFGNAKVNAPVTEWSETSFTVQVPIGATSGKISLMVYTKPVNTPVDEFTIRQHAGLTELSPVAAYKGEEVTIKGKNFGTTAEGVKVLVGGVEAEVISCSEEEIKIRIPIGEALEDGKEVAVKVTTPYEEVDGELNFTVKTTPTIDREAGISPSEGFIGTIVTINGSNMPETSERLVVKFGEVSATITDYQYKTEEGIAKFTVKVPNGLSDGNVQMTLSIGELQFYEETFKVNPSPVMNSVTETVVLVGEIVTIKGEHFGIDKSAVTAYLNETEVEITSIKDNEIVIKVPDDFGTTKNVQISLQYADIPTVEGKIINVMGQSGDVTEVVLENCQAPFDKTADALVGGWGIPTNWQFNDKFYYQEEGGKNVLIRPLIIDDNNPQGAISILCNQWAEPNHRHAFENAKMYQCTKLPTGKYKLSFTVAESNTLGGRLGVILGITKGNNTLPDLKEEDAWNPETESDFIDGHDGTKSYVKMTRENILLRKDGPRTYDMTFTLSEMTEVTIGFVANISLDNGNKKGGNIEVSSISVERQ